MVTSGIQVFAVVPAQALGDTCSNACGAEPNDGEHEYGQQGIAMYPPGGGGRGVS